MLAVNMLPTLGAVVDSVMIPGSSMLMTSILTEVVASLVGGDSAAPEASSPSVTLTVTE